jgi:pimeloyl-ACP methyl ester carboxylesterase
MALRTTLWAFHACLRHIPDISRRFNGRHRTGLTGLSVRPIVAARNLMQTTAQHCSNPAEQRRTSRPRWRLSRLAAALLPLAAFGFAAAQAAQLPIQAPTVASTATAYEADALGTLRHVRAGVLDVSYAEVGPADGPVVVLLHGWPYDIHSYSAVAPLLAAQGYRVLIPAARGYGDTRFLSDQTARNGQPAALATDVIDFMNALGVKTAVLGGYDWGARSADIVAALWPERVKALVSVSGYLIGNQAAGKNPLPPKSELQWWYQFYFATERGAAGYEKNRHDFARLIWQTASPQWAFDDATFERSAGALNNPDHVTITVSNYRWRLGIVQGEPRYDAAEQRLAQTPDITVPTVALEGDANGAPHPSPQDYARHFTGKYVFRLISGGIGHNLPQENPPAFAKAIIDADHL